MEQISEVERVHPESEAQKALNSDIRSWHVDTPGGRYYAEWDSEAPVTRERQLIMFQPCVLTCSDSVMTFCFLGLKNSRNLLIIRDGARYRVRTCDFLRVKQALYR